MAFYQDMPWHEGEQQMAKSMKTPYLDNPTVPTLSPQLANHLQIAPLIAIGTVDSESRPWVTLLGGQKGMSQPLGSGIIGIKTAVAEKHDPVIELLVGNEPSGEIRREEGKGRMVSGLTIDLETRKRVKMYGRMIAGALSEREDEAIGRAERIAEMQLVLKIEQSLGNCPKYLNKKKIEPALSRPKLVSESPQLPQEALQLIEKSDLFFVSSAQHDQDMDANHRGGPPGFVRVASNGESGAVLLWPEYSGNRLYQTLGNLAVNSVAGLCFPDFDTGNMLYLTGRTEILVGKDASAELPRSNLCVRLTVTAARFVSDALPFRGILGERSPYNPTVRYLASEKPPPQSKSNESQQATLLSQTKLTSTISRFRFSLENSHSFKPGQYVTLDFSDHLDIGYSHMRDDDPRSINDDFVRTFTVSSPPGSNPVRNLKDDEFEITIRKVGVATEFLFKHQGANDRMRLEIGVKGFGGEFEIQQQDENDQICFVAAGVGITPILPSLWSLNLDCLRLLWSVRKEDIALVLDILDQHPYLNYSLQTFISNAPEDDEDVLKLKNRDVDVKCRRIEEQDLRQLDMTFSRYYLCTALPMRKQLMQWLPGKELVFEDFNF